MAHRIGLVGVSLFVVAGALSHARPAQACGGCFHSSQESIPSMVVGHRMALSISPERTVLWDQVEYTGNPEDFAWVLPVGPGAVLELANDAWFESLEAVTATRVMSRTVVCPGGQSIRQVDSSSGFSGCGSGSPGARDSVVEEKEDTELGRQGSDPDVAVTHQETVGPYETVTLKAADAASLSGWLTNHGYVIPDDIAPVIQSYVDEGAEFIALRLAPGNGVSQMQPVRVVTPGASPILPLRMVAAGTGENVALVLYLIGEGRYRTENFPETSIDTDLLAWDWDAQESNFSELRSLALAENDGKTWVPTFARYGALTASITAADGQTATYSAGTSQYDNLADLYFAQAAANDGLDTTCDVTDVASSSDMVVTDCDVAGCNIGEIDAAWLACDGYDDIAAATIGLHPADVWVTRIEALLPRSGLDVDLQLGAHPSQAFVPNWYTADLDQNEPPCPNVDTDTDPVYDGPRDNSSCFCSASPGRGLSVGSAGMLALGAWFAARRLRRRRPR